MESQQYDDQHSVLLASLGGRRDGNKQKELEFFMHETNYD